LKWTRSKAAAWAELPVNKGGVLESDDRRRRVRAGKEEVEGTGDAGVGG